jgi:hypothetical protein
MGMNQSGRIVLLSSSVVLLIIGVVCLKQRLGYQESPPVFVPGDVTNGPSVDHRVTRQPTILSTEPGSESSSSMHPSWHDPDSFPARNLAPAPQAQPTFPINNEASPNDKFKPWEESSSTQLEAPFGENATQPDERPAPPLPEVLPNATRQPVVITKQDDSLWTISEQTYGQGGYYRALFAVNKDRIPRPDRIQAGTEIQTPPLEELRQLYPDLCPTSRDLGS